MLTKKEIIDIANKFAKENQTPFIALQFSFVAKSVYIDGDWDVSFKLLNTEGQEIDGSLLVVINGENGEVNSMEEIIMKHKINASNVDIPEDVIVRWGGAKRWQ
ncbi:MAG: hypothetical protein K2O32_12570 [Acetatifactor sp.]|nr:hypothetical protein [Acetatifactor sp.]